MSGASEARIIELKQAGYRHNDIAKTLKCRKGTVSLVLAKYALATTGKLPNHMPWVPRAPRQIDWAAWMSRGPVHNPKLRWLMEQAKRRDERCGIKNRYVGSGRR